MKQNLLLCVLLAGMLMLAACGGSSVPQSIDTPAGTDQAAGIEATLPDPAALQIDTGRDLSVAGPGWYSINLQYRNFGGNEQGVTDDLPAIDIAGAGGNGYSVFGVHGFDGDCYPTSLRSDVIDVVGEYYMMYTNYIDGRWMTAGPFTDSVTYEYPEVSQYSDPEILASARHNHYVAILVPDGSSLRLNMLQLGVDGGNEGPFPVVAIAENSNESIISIQWLHSPSFNEPDFAGYSVERAPFPIGEFVTISEENTFDSVFEDPEPGVNEPFMYRVRCWDTAGNNAVSMTIVAIRNVGDMALPTCVVDMPKGPLYGPVEVTFDLSGSYDNDGDVITDYYFDFGSGLGEVSQPDPVLTTTLQPGCYMISFAAKAGGFTGSTLRMLKIYPQWEESSQLVTEGTPLAPRYWLPRSFYDEASEKVVFLFADAATPSLVSMTVDKDGNVDRHDSPQILDGPVVAICEPVFVDGQWLFTIADSDNLIVCGWQDNVIDTNFLANLGVDAGFACMVTDGNGTAWILYYDGIAPYEIKILSINNPGSTLLVTGLVSAGEIDAEWNEDAEAIDLLYSGNTKTEWLRWSPVIGPIGNFVLSGADSEFIDVEQDPATGRPTALFSDGPNVRFADLNPDDATWTAPLPVDPIDPDWPYTKLLYRNGNSYCFVGDNPGDAKLYRRNGANWDVINTADYPGGGYFISMAYNPDLPGFMVMDTASDYATRITQMQEDDSEQQLYISKGWDRNGLELSAISSNSEIHLIHKPLFNYIHWTSPDGDTWTETSDAGVGFGGKIVVDENGEIYTGIANLGVSKLNHWVDPAWVPEDNHSISPNTAPLVYGQGGVMLFGNFDNLAVPAEFNYKVNLTPTQTTFPNDNDVLGGAFAGSNGSNYRIMVLFGASDITDADVGILSTSTGVIDKIFEPGFNRFDDEWTFGRSYEGANFRNAFASTREVFYFSYGPNNTYARMDRNLFGEWDVHEYGIIFQPELLYESRNCVSAMTAWGNTAVGIGSGVMGDVGFFEWSDFGNWEELPVPSGMDNGSLHELVVGPDGRWHIIYRDFVNDDLRIISTVE
ncbi:MAG: hypothetical protein H7A35_02140 [Planctomycetales bacterium]|nr:hypothetical protein [bacterium]UNM08859.1 MAG: hypothetical protein H7A35_02140 [Planctomycetales bacterium]